MICWRAELLFTGISTNKRMQESWSSREANANFCVSKEIKHTLGCVRHGVVSSSREVISNNPPLPQH